MGRGRGRGRGRGKGQNQRVGKRTEEMRMEIQRSYEEKTQLEEEEMRMEMNEEYKIWKNNTPFLYDLVLTHVLECPSLTVEWLPDRHEPPGEDYSVHDIILGTQAYENEPNYLMVAEVQIPLESAEIPNPYYDKEGPDVGGFNGNVQIKHQIKHDGEVNRARCMPQNPFIIATKTVSGQVHLFFDYSKHTSNPDLRLIGHTDEGWGLSWSKFRFGHLLSGSDDSLICLWDINATPNKKSLYPTQAFKVDEGAVEDVAWHLMHEYLFGSVGSEQNLLIWDLRTPYVTKPAQSVVAHLYEVNCLTFNPFNEWLVATGSSDETVKLFDLRKISTALYTFDGHEEEVTQVCWNPKNETILASSCHGRRLLVWDISRIGEVLKAENMIDGPPELLFIHGGHTSKIWDFSWNQNEEWVVASVSEDNILQIWQMSEIIYYNDEDLMGRGPQAE